MYQFSSKQLFVLLICTVALGVLTFSAGVITGLGLAMPTREEVAMLKGAKAPKLAVAAGALHLPAAVPPVAPPAVPQTVPQAASAVLPKPAAAVPQAAPAHAEQAPQAPQPAAPPAQAPAAATAATAAPAPAMADSQTDQNAFALQLGSFRDMDHAKKFQTELKDRGYSTSILTALDPDQREWHLVRIEGFQTLASASQAAARFIDKERMPAVVRRSKTL